MKQTSLEAFDSGLEVAHFPDDIDAPPGPEDVGIIYEGIVGFIGKTAVALDPAGGRDITFLPACERVGKSPGFITV